MAKKSKSKSESGGVRKQIEQKYGVGSVMLLGESASLQVDVAPTGYVTVDHALGIGGFPRGRVVEVFGPESSGKTTLALRGVAQTQKAGDKAAYIDVEHALDPAWARKLGVNTNELMLSQPDTAEQALDITEMFVKSGEVSFIVIDSVAALVPRAELEGEMGDTHVALQARLMSQAMRRLTGAVAKSNACVVFINQVREKIGGMRGTSLLTPGGRALKFYSSVRISLAFIGQEKVGEKIIGSRIEAFIKKNKIAPPFRKALFVILWEGYDKAADICYSAFEHKVFKQSGSWYSFGDLRLGNGKAAVVEMIRHADSSLKKKIQKAVNKALEAHYS